MYPQDAFQHYQILRREDGSLHELGRGAMGVTFKAFDTNLRCPVALKVVNGMFLHDEAARARFLREARAAAALRHRNVAAVHHLCGDGDHFFYAMEFIDGETVEDWVRRTGRLPVEVALRVVHQVARALGAAHKKNLVHRDIKPANLMVVREDEDEVDDDNEEQYLVKLIDFGLARAFYKADAPQPASTTPTFAGFVGTPAYSSPEQLDEKELDTRSDVYSLGVTLWFMLTGRTPFTGALSQIYQQHVLHEMPWDQLAGEPAPVVALLRHLLQKDPAQRPQNPAELRARVARCLRAVQAAHAGRTPAADGAADGLEDGETSPENGTDAGLTVLFSKSVEPVKPAPGLMLANGLRLGPLVGEGRRGLVFQGMDPRREGEVVAVKVYHSDLLKAGTSGGTEFTRRRELAGRVRVAPHPHLLEVVALERHRHFQYLVTEWVNGFTLVGLLGKRGTLTVAECLRLLRQVADAAGHARAHGLTNLELAPHQILVHFPGNLRIDDPADQAIFRAPLTEWPEFSLKVDAMGDDDASPGAGGILATWSGNHGVTQVPDARGRREAEGDAPDLRALGILVYELLGGAGTLVRLGDHAEVIGGANGEREARVPILPILGEEGNAILQRALSAAPGFADEGEFYAALARATGFDPETFRPARPVPMGTAPGQRHAGGSRGGNGTNPPVAPLPAGSRVAAVPVGRGAAGSRGTRLRRWSAEPWGARLGTRLRGIGARGRAIAGVGLLGLAGLTGWAVARHGGSPVAPVAVLPTVGTTTSTPLTRAPEPAFSGGVEGSPRVLVSRPEAIEKPETVLPPPAADRPTTPPLPGDGARLGVIIDPTPSAPAGSSVMGGGPLPPASAPMPAVLTGAGSVGSGSVASSASETPPAPAAASVGLPGPVASGNAATAASPAAEEEERAEVKKGSPRKRSASRSTSRRRRTPRQEPNFFQRVFGIRPRP